MCHTTILVLWSSWEINFTLLSLLPHTFTIGDSNYPSPCIPTALHEYNAQGFVNVSARVINPARWAVVVPTHAFGRGDQLVAVTESA